MPKKNLKYTTIIKAAENAKKFENNVNPKRPKFQENTVNSAHPKLWEKKVNKAARLSFIQLTRVAFL